MGLTRVHPLPSKLRPAASHEVSDSLGDVSAAKKAAKKLKQVYDESKLLREFLLYLAFVAVFSFVSFCSKPGITQYHLTTEAKSVWGPTDVNQVADIWTWLENTFLTTTYPQVDYNGGLLDRTSRLYVLGQARLAGGIRLRQVRSRDVPCQIPGSLKQVYGQIQQCTSPYSSSNRDHDPVLADLAPPQNFTLPLLYQDYGALNTSSWYWQAGDYSKYSQDGFALDLIPNLGPKDLANLVLGCRPFLEAGLRACMQKQGVSAPSIYGQRMAQNGSLPAPLPNCNQSDPLLVPPSLDVSRCAAVCPSMPYVGFQQLLQLASDAQCGLCACQPDLSPVCSQTCNASALASQQMALLQANDWIDHKTRAVIVDLTLFEADYNLFTTVRVLFELPPFGGAYGKPVVRTNRLYRYVTSMDKVVLAFEIIFCAMVAWYTLEEGFELYWEGWRAYFSQAWNICDWANLVIFYAVIALRVTALVSLNRFRLEADTTKYVDFQAIGYTSTQELNVSALNFFLVYFKLFKFLSRVPRMEVILSTLTLAAVDLCLFSVTAVIIMFGFSAAFYVCFGMEVYRWRTLGASLGSLVRLILGDIDYDSMVQANAIMAPILFYTYAGVVWFILMQMFVAIITESYQEIKDSQQDDNHFFSDLRHTVRSVSGRLLGLFGLRQAAARARADIGDADANLDSLIDEAELAAALKDNARAYELLKATGPKEILAKYDVDRNGLLDKSEVTSILKELALREAEIHDDIEKVQAAAPLEKLDARKSRGARQAAALAEVAKAGVEGLEKPGADGLGDAQLRAISGLEQRLERVEGQLNELNRSLSKKLGILVDLVMAQADQSSLDGSLPGASSRSPSRLDQEFSRSPSRLGNSPGTRASSRVGFSEF